MTTLRAPTLILLLLGCAAAARGSTAAEIDHGLALRNAGDLSGAVAVFAGILAKQPDDMVAREHLAIVIGWQGDHAGALAQWDQVLAHEPQRRSALLGKARVLYWMQRLAESRRLLDALAVRFPTDADVQELLGDVARAEGDSAAAQRAYLAAGTDGAAAKRAGLAHQRVRRWRLDAGGMLDHFDPDSALVAQRDQEHSTYLQLGRRLSDSVTLSAGLDEAEQFDLHDVRYNLRAYWTPSPWLALDAMAAITPQAQVMPEHEGGLGAELRLGRTLTLLAGFHSSQYEEERVDRYAPGLRLALPADLTLEARYLYGTSTVNPSTNAMLARLLLDHGRWHPYVLFSTGEDNLPPQGTAITTTFAGGAVVDLDAAWSVRFDLLWEDREDTYVRRSLGGGVVYRF